MKKLLLAAVLTALSAPAFADTLDRVGAVASPATPGQIEALANESDSANDTIVTANNEQIDYSTTQAIAEEVPYGLQLRNAEILYNRFNR